MQSAKHKRRPGHPNNLQNGKREKKKTHRPNGNGNASLDLTFRLVGLGVPPPRNASTAVTSVKENNLRIQGHPGHA